MRLASLLLLALIAAATEPLPVVATTPEIGAIVQAIGGDAVRLSVLARPDEDPHRVEARPSFVVALSRAELLVANGAELEVGWLPPLVTQARNPRIRADGTGYLEAAWLCPRMIGVPTQPLDRSAGDVHAHGNPHVLLDPAVGLALAEELAKRFGASRPAAAAAIATRLAAFRLALGNALVGEKLGSKLDIAKLILLDDNGRLDRFLSEQHLASDLGGWWGRLRPSAGRAVAADHDLYPYFVRRFGLRVTVFLEPKPGVPPSTRHLAQVAERMRREGVGALLATPYFDRKVIDLAAQAAGVRVAEMSHQAGARRAGEDYLAWVDGNVQAVAAALAP